MLTFSRQLLHRSSSTTAQHCPTHHLRSRFYPVILGLFAAITYDGVVDAQSTVVLDQSNRVQGTAIRRSGIYDYAPTVLWQQGKFRMWWCGGVAGDYVLYSEALTPSGPWTTPAIAFKPTPNSFDSWHTCDPTVVLIGTTYYLYYTACNRSDGTNSTIGVATSTDGKKFTRARSLPIIYPRIRNSGKYGAGQPSAVYLGGYVYLIYTDTTGRDSFDGGMPAGAVYVIRSTDPLFRGAVEELTRNGFVRRFSTGWITTEYALRAENYGRFHHMGSVDLQFNDVLNAFLIAFNGYEDQSEIYVFDRDFRYKQSITVPNVVWRDGSGIVRRSDGHSIGHGTGAIDRMHFIAFYGTGLKPRSEDDREAIDTWDIGYTGVDLRFVPID